MNQEQNGGTTSFVVDLDDDTTVRFSGLNKQTLHVKAYQGIRNVGFPVQGDKGVFRWIDGVTDTRLSAQLGTRHEPHVSHDDERPTAVGTALGAQAPWFCLTDRSSKVTAVRYSGSEGAHRGSHRLVSAGTVPSRPASPRTDCLRPAGGRWSRCGWISGNRQVVLQKEKRPILRPVAIFSLRWWIRW